MTSEDDSKPETISVKLSLRYLPTIQAKLEGKDRLDTTTEESPIRLLPSEILLNIFDLYVYGSFPLPSDCFNDVPFEPWLLSQVCGAWRNIVFSSPCLWRQVSLVRRLPFWWRLEDISTNREKAALHLLSQHMVFANDQPLRLLLHFWTYRLANYYAKLLDILLPHRHLWRSLEYHHHSYPPPDYDMDKEVGVELEGYNLAQRLFIPSSTTLAFTLLENLELFVPDGAIIELSNNIKFPRLKSIEFWSFYPWPSSSPLPWSNLEDVQIADISFPSLHSTLRLLVNVRFLSVERMHRSGHTFVPVDLPKLEKLSSETESIVLDMITAPSLKTLISKHDYEGVDVSSLVNMIERSSCSISTLEICLPIHPTPPILPLFPDVTKISITMSRPRFGRPQAAWNFTRATDALSARTTDDEAFMYCPLLETITVSNSTQWLDNVENRSTVMDLIEARYSDQLRAPHLRSVRLTHCDAKWADVDFSERLEALRARGLDFRILPAPPGRFSLDE